MLRSALALLSSLQIGLRIKESIERSVRQAIVIAVAVAVLIAAAVFGLIAAYQALILSYGFTPIEAAGIIAAALLLLGLLSLATLPLFGPKRPVHAPDPMAAAAELQRNPKDAHGFARVAHFHVASIGWHYVDATVLAKLIAEIAAETEKKVGWMRNLGGGMDVEVTVFRGAGAYICGEETALLNSLEGLRGQPRLRPPFPAVEGLYACPTAINNVETLANVPAIVRNGAEWFAGIGTQNHLNRLAVDL